jgi:uncharacterized protein YjbI with pentapeptide repeats
MNFKVTSRSIGLIISLGAIFYLSPASSQNRSDLDRLLVDKDCQKCDLRQVNLNGFDLGGAQLQGSNLAGSSLRGTILIGANLSGASFEDADLTGGVLTAANLNGTSFRFANLENVVLYRAKAKPKPADFSGAILKQTQLPDGKIIKEVAKDGGWTISK